MNFNENVNKDFVDQVLESALWAKAKVNVNREAINESAGEEVIEVIPEYEDGVVNEYEEPTDMDTQYAASDEEELSFSLDDLQVVLDNLDDESLMEHAMNMLEVFDVAFENLNEEEDIEEDEDDFEELDERRRDWGGNKGDKSRTHHGRDYEQKWGGNKGDESETDPGDEDYTTKKGMKKKTGKGRAFRRSARK